MTTAPDTKTPFRDFRPMRFGTQTDHLCTECDGLIESGTRTCLFRESGTRASRRAYICIGCVWKAKEELDAQIERVLYPRSKGPHGFAHRAPVSTFQKRMN